MVLSLLMKLKGFCMVSIHRPVATGKAELEILIFYIEKESDSERKDLFKV